MDRLFNNSTNTPEITLADLPPRDTKRWLPRRKATVVAAVRAGIITLEDACVRYALSVEEFLSWLEAIERGGEEGLRATEAQEHRSSQKRVRHLRRAA